MNHFATIRCYYLKDGRELAFISAWKAVADMYYRYAGSYGSRLHKVNEHKYCVYTLWPNSESFTKSDDRFPLAALALQAKLRSCCTKIESAMEMGILVDHMHMDTYTTG